MVTLEVDAEEAYLFNEDVRVVWSSEWLPLGHPLRQLGGPPEPWLFEASSETPTAPPSLWERLKTRCEFLRTALRSSFQPWNGNR